MLIIHPIDSNRYNKTKQYIELDKRYAIINSETGKIVKSILGSTIVNHLRADERQGMPYRYSNFDGSFTYPSYMLDLVNCISDKYNNFNLTVSKYTQATWGNFKSLPIGLLYMSKIKNWYLRIGAWCYPIVCHSLYSTFLEVGRLDDQSITHLSIGSAWFMWRYYVNGTELTFVSTDENIQLQFRNIEHSGKILKFILCTCFAKGKVVQSVLTREDYVLDLKSGDLKRVSNGEITKGVGLDIIARNMVFM